MRPNFKNIDIKNAGFAATNAAEWAKANGIEANWKTPEHVQHSFGSRFLQCVDDVLRSELFPEWYAFLWTKRPCRRNVCLSFAVGTFGRADWIYLFREKTETE